MFFYILIFLAGVVIILLFSKIKINIEDLKISTKNYMNMDKNNDYKITISLVFLHKFILLQSKITKDKLDKLNLKNKINKIRFKKIGIGDIDKYKPKIKFIQLVMNIATEDAVITSFLVAVLSSALGIILKDTLSRSEESRFIINPIYINKNFLNIELKCIIEIKLIHIIYIIYILNRKRRDDKYARTSYRRSYGYSYE